MYSTRNQIPSLTLLCSNKNSFPLPPLSLLWEKTEKSKEWIFSHFNHLHHILLPKKQKEYSFCCKNRFSIPHFFWRRYKIIKNEHPIKLFQRWNGSVWSFTVRTKPFLMTLKPFHTVSIRKDLLIQETKSYKQKDSCNKLQLSFLLSLSDRYLI